LLRFSPLFLAQLHGHTIATLHYARGIAHAVLGDTTAAAQDLALLKHAMPLVGGDHVLHNNLCSDMLAIAEHMLQGELHYRLGELQLYSYCVWRCIFIVYFRVLFV